MMMLIEGADTCAITSNCTVFDAVGAVTCEDQTDVVLVKFAVTCNCVLLMKVADFGRLEECRAGKGGRSRPATNQ